MAMIEALRASGSSRCSASASATRRSGVVYGATVGRAPELLHGKTSVVRHDGTGVLAGLPVAVHRHPLPLADDRPGDTMTDQLVATAHTESGVIMAVRHVSLPLEGVQFHPESVLTEGGHRLLANWLVTCGAGRRRRAGRGPEPAGARRRGGRPHGCRGLVAAAGPARPLRRAGGGREPAGLAGPGGGGRGRGAGVPGVHAVGGRGPSGRPVAVRRRWRRPTLVLGTALRRGRCCGRCGRAR